MNLDELAPVLRRMLLLLLLVAMSPLAAWGPHGHQVVAEIAARELNPTARAEVERLLGDRAGNAMREASTWADEIRGEERWRHTGSWHYLNFERGDCSYIAKQNCRGGNCVVGAIEREARILADRKASKAKRANALRFVIHFVGDVHQPLHAGFSHDRGGNDFQVRYGRDGGNLHGFWDQDIIRADRGRLAVNPHADDVFAAPGPDGDWHWHDNAAATWAEASCSVVQQPDFYPPRGRIDDAYVRRFAPVVDDQLEAAGHRLAALLNQILGPSP
jgi:hypothetical protein